MTNLKENNKNQIQFNLNQKIIEALIFSSSEPILYNDLKKIIPESDLLDEILKSLGIRSRGVNIISCPSCARQAFPVIETVKELEKKLSHVTTPITLSIIGCVVNGPGEAAQTEIGLTGGGQDNNLLYLSGLPHTKVASAEIIDKVVQLVEDKVKEKSN